jgi:1-acyl-sn-glycerol-3-phosphate acyltransferase
MPDWLESLWYEFNYCTVWAGFTLGFSLRTEGAYRVPRNGPVLILANHESFLDPLAVGLAVRRRIRYLARKTLFKPAWFGNYLRSVGCIPVDQEGVAKEGIRASLDVLQAGHALLIFPEGERTSTGQMLPFKPGILLLMKKFPVPILPVGVAGAYEAFPRTARIPKVSPLFWTPTGASLAVSVGHPIPPERFQDMERDRILTTLFEEIQAQVRRAERLRRDPTLEGKKS